MRGDSAYGLGNRSLLMAVWMQETVCAHHSALVMAGAQHPAT